ncbi:hypothetical protein [Aneurinibacillus migulanus]|uniref:Uncharacterized protein n=1 Tax=Aneurinibacillus migulanus TaxID=47500 RepID=A0A0D1V9W9_ANEMI|nr:hypothetical protein [Aneurinibacillus migulanus]KIV56199.1 hypothetical protein TS65_13330 [Aneurinibacillus migulanus]KON84263.1 hypothetical protein AF333_30475 [Aneurinibacillus migulanus]MED0893809.1 hypothetical protein [Aneurinibacillus migulanus]MED1614488.1 hypothetical protein [Aneurinibacillus migulanus]SDI83468.1 hypothetical protein SAMN04487909_108109 [Aneurinibacillus migulanus]
MNNQSNFRAYVVGLNATDKKMKLTMELDSEIKAEDLLAITKMRGHYVFVTLGDPQLSMDFGDENEEEETSDAEPITYQTDSSGVVINMFNTKPEGEEPDTAGQEDGNPDDTQEETEQEPDNTEQGPTEEEVEEYILSGKAPHFEDIEFDFPELLHKKKNIGSWTQVAANMGISIGKLRRDYKTYKARVAEQMRDGDTA